MANKLIAGTNYFDSFSDGEGGGASSFFNYSPNLDINFAAIASSVNSLVDEVRGVQGPNQTLILDVLVLDDPTGVGATTSVVVGTDSYAVSLFSTTRVDVTAGVAVIASNKVASSSGTVALAPRLGTLDVVWWDFIALDVNGEVTINTTPGSQALDLYRVEVNAAGSLFISPINLEKLGTWQYAIDGDAWVEMSDATSLGGTTFPQVLSDEPKVRINQMARLMSGFTTDLQPTPATIGPLVIPGGTEALPGLVLGDGSGTNDLDTGWYRVAADRIRYSVGGVDALEIDAAGQLDLITNFRVKGRRTDSQTLTDASGLVEVVFTAADEFDVGSWHAADADFTVPTDGGGTYLITAAIEWATAVTNRRDIRVEIQLDDTLITGGQAGARLEIDEDHASVVTVVAVLAAAEVVTVLASHDDVDGALGLDIIDATISIVKVA
jgi:hypothetical protein